MVRDRRDRSELHRGSRTDRRRSGRACRRQPAIRSVRTTQVPYPISLPCNALRLCTKGPSGLTSFCAFPPTYSYPTLCHHDQSSLAQQVRMLFDQLSHRLHLLCHRHLDEADDTRMRQPAHKHQFAKVFVLRDEDSSFFYRQSQDFFVRRAWVPLNRRQDIMPLGYQCVLHAPGRGANVEEESHRAARMGIRSCTCSPATER